MIPQRQSRDCERRVSFICTKLTEQSITGPEAGSLLFINKAVKVSQIKLSPSRARGPPPHGSPKVLRVDPSSYTFVCIDRGNLI